MASKLGARLRGVRESRGVGIKAVAPQVGLTYSYLSKIENGLATPSEETLEKLAAYYGLDADVLEVLAGRLPEDIVEILQGDPEGAIKYLRKRFGS